MSTATKPTATAPDTTQGAPTINRALAFATVALALLMMSVDSTIVATALHALQRGLDTSINWVGWTITAYSFGFVLMLPISGRLSERYGRRRVFLASVVTFTVASLCCALAQDIYMLIALRALQAAGGAGFTPSATGIVVDYFGDMRDRAVSLFGSIFPVGAMIGPIFGGLFVRYWSWRGVFFVNVPIGLAIMLLALRQIPPDPPRARDAAARMDAAGMSLLGGGLLAGMLAASYLGERHTTAASPLFVLPLAAAVTCIVLFFRHIHRCAEPFLAPRLVHGPDFGAVNLFNMLVGGVTLGSVALVPLYAADRYGLDALSAGTLLIAEGAAAIAMTVASAFALRRTGHRPPLYVGGTVIACGMLLLACRPWAGIPPYAWLAGATLLIGAGYGTTNPASRNAGLQLAPQRSSTIAALRTMCLQVGSISTVSIATAIIASASAPGSVQSRCYAVAALVVLAAMALIVRRVPEHRGAW